MPRVKCPHCGAGNQDATEEDTCWQCSSVLGSPVTRAENVRRPSAAAPSEPTQQLNVEMLRNMTPEAPNPLRLQEDRPIAPRPGLNPVVILLGALLVFVLILLIFVLTRH